MSDEQVQVPKKLPFPDWVFALIEVRDADHVRAIASAGIPSGPVSVVLPPEVKRPLCKVCGRPVGLRTCVPIKTAVIMNS
jgi:hypothetical protein